MGTTEGSSFPSDGTPNRQELGEGEVQLVDTSESSENCDAPASSPSEAEAVAHTNNPPGGNAASPTGPPLGEGQRAAVTGVEPLVAGTNGEPTTNGTVPRAVPQDPGSTEPIRGNMTRSQQRRDRRRRDQVNATTEAVAVVGPFCRNPKLP